MIDHPVIVDVVPGGDPPHILVSIGDRMARLPLRLSMATRLLEKLMDYVVTRQTAK